jgi:hypothetical protein
VTLHIRRSDRRRRGAHDREIEIKVTPRALALLTISFLVLLVATGSIKSEALTVALKHLPSIVNAR